MRAIRVRRRLDAELYTVHWLMDEERTFCGRKPAELNVVAELELETLPTIEGCRGCARVVDGWPKPAAPAAERRTTLPASLGTLRTTGSLAHGTRKRGARRL